MREATYTEMLEKIYRYEMEKDKISQTVDFNTNLQMYTLKESLSNGEIKELYVRIIREEEELEAKAREAAEAFTLDEPEEVEDIAEDYKEAETKTEQITVTKELKLVDSNIYVSRQTNKGEEVSTYSYKNLQNALKRYTSIAGKKKAGYKYEGKLYPVIANEGNGEFSYEYEGDEDIEFFRNYYSNVLCESIRNTEQLQFDKEKEAMLAKERADELRINPKFGREFSKILKKENACCLKDKDFTAFDFRNLSLSDMVFVSCTFAHADFTDLRISDTVFADCDLSFIRQEGLVFDNCKFFGCKKQQEEE